MLIDLLHLWFHFLALITLVTGAVPRRVHLIGVMLVHLIVVELLVVFVHILHALFVHVLLIIVYQVVVDLVLNIALASFIRTELITVIVDFTLEVIFADLFSVRVLVDSLKLLLSVHCPLVLFFI